MTTRKTIRSRSYGLGELAKYCTSLRRIIKLSLTFQAGDRLLLPDPDFSHVRSSPAATFHTRVPTPAQLYVFHPLYSGLSTPTSSPAIFEY